MDKKAPFEPAVKAVLVCTVNRKTSNPGGGLGARCSRISHSTKLTDRKVLEIIKSHPHDRLEDIDVLRCYETTRGIGITTHYYYRYGEIKRHHFAIPKYGLITPSPSWCFNTPPPS